MDCRKRTIVFLGDSITDAFHKMNVDEEKLGNGYVSVISRKLRDMGRNDFVRNSGHDGFTVTGLLRLFSYDCQQFSPDIVSVLIGSNDAALEMNTGKTLEEQQFAENYKKLLERIRTCTKAEIICMGPFIFPYPMEYSNWIPVIRRIEKIQKDIAEEYGAVFLPLQDVLNEKAISQGYEKITPDGTHLAAGGAEFVADLWLQAADLLKI